MECGVNTPIIQKVSRRSNVKYNLDRLSFVQLLNIVMSFGVTSQFRSNYLSNLENINLEAARIVTCAIQLVSVNTLY